jgi:O-antigen ligase
MVATVGAALIVFLVYSPALHAPFVVPKFAALDIAACIGLLAFALQRVMTGRPAWTRSLTAGATLVLATSAIAWIAALGRPAGAPYAVAALARWGSVFGLACGASVLADAPEARQRLLEAVTLAAAAVAAIGLLQHLEILPLSIPVISTPGSTFGNRNVAAEAVAMALPLSLSAVLGARRREGRLLSLAALALGLVFLAVTRARGAWLGGATGLGASLWLARRRWPRAPVALAVGVGVLAAGAAASLPGRFNPRDVGDSKRYSGIGDVLHESFDSRSTALRTRFGLWRRTVSMIADRPIAGVGPGNWPVEFPRYAEPGATRDGVLSATLAPRQVHDDLLERAAETGLPGLGALGLLGAGAVRAVRRRLREPDRDSRNAAAGAAGALVALVVMAVASFPLEMPGTLALTGFALGLIAPQTGSLPSELVPPRGALPPPRGQWFDYALFALALGLAAGTALRAERCLRSSRWLASAERAMHRDASAAGAPQALGALSYALQADPDDFRARLRRAQLLLREHRARESSAAARRALAIEPFAPNAWAALAAAELEAGEHEAARRDAGQALALLHDFPLALYVRARAAERGADADAAGADRQLLAALAAGAEDEDTARAARALLRGDLVLRAP